MRRRANSRFQVGERRGCEAYTLVEVVVYAGMLMAFMCSLFVLLKRCRQLTRATHTQAAAFEQAVCVRGVFEKDVRLSDGELPALGDHQSSESTLILHLPKFAAGGERAVIYHWDGTALDRIVLDAKGTVESRRCLARLTGATFRRKDGELTLELSVASRRGARPFVFAASPRNRRVSEEVE